MVTVLAGGTGGAKLAAGLADAAGDVTVIANTGDDVEIYGVHVSPDPDLVTWWLAGIIDERGWGIADDTFEAMKREADPWFQLGDRDLELCRLRTERLAAGARLTDAHAAVVAAVGVDQRVFPMCDEPVRTHVRTPRGLRPFQEFMIVDGWAGPIEEVVLEGIDAARVTPEVTAALSTAEAIVIGPSNPVISIGPILAVPGMRDALRAARAPVVAVSPFVGGRAVKGPTDDFCHSAGIELSAQGIADAYAELIDGVVADEPVAGMPGLVTDTLMDDAAARGSLARKILDFAASLPSRRGA
ncbi:MAG TPA: 2-phospho-L-lactate transferase CofD family protein [Thermoleophilaceae bacterium]|nr:2-phospho-L-lactate transferase CofD family protein [Thermoleophilaceae bacterium]